MAQVDIKEALAKKYGPLPGAAWLFIIAAVGFYFFKTHGAAGGKGAGGTTVPGGKFSSTTKTKDANGNEVSYTAEGPTSSFLSTGALGNWSAGPMPSSAGDIFVNIPGSPSTPGVDYASQITDLQDQIDELSRPRRHHHDHGGWDHGGDDGGDGGGDGGGDWGGHHGDGGGDGGWSNDWNGGGSDNWGGDTTGQDNGTPPPQETTLATSPTTYTVAPGDSLSSIAQSFYHGSKDYTDIYTANQGLIGPDPNMIQPGTALVIPNA